MNALEVMALRAPELVPSVLDIRAIGIVNYVRTRINYSLYGDQGENAVALYALHLMAKDSMGTSVSGGGQITGETEGQLSRSYAGVATTVAGSDLASTAFGKEYLALRSAFVHPFMTSAM